MRTHLAGKLDIDQSRLLEELKAIDTFEYSDAYNNFLCGYWKSCMLYSLGGRAGDGFLKNYERQALAKTNYAEQLPYVCEIVERFFDLERLKFVRLAILTPKSVIIPHKDLLELDELLHRVHVPLITDEGCFFSEGNVVYRMRFGEAWFFNAAAMHSAASFSDNDRLHLILDFEDRGDPQSLVMPHSPGSDIIPTGSVCERKPLSGEEREALLSLARVVDINNYKDIFSIIIKKHYRRDGGEDFVWQTLLEIASSCHDQVVSSQIHDLYRYFLIERAA